MSSEMNEKDNVKMIVRLSSWFAMPMGVALVTGGNLGYGLITLGAEAMIYHYAKWITS